MENKNTCISCGVTQPITNFTKHSTYASGRMNKCKKCCAIYYRKLRGKSSYDPIHNMYWGAHQRAKTKGLEFNLTKEFIKSIYPKNGECPLLNIKMVVADRKRTRSSPSLDRIDPTRGYTKDNVQIISWQANTMKNNATLKELLLFCENTISLISVQP